MNDSEGMSWAPTVVRRPFPTEGEGARWAEAPQALLQAIPAPLTTNFGCVAWVRGKGLVGRVTWTAKERWLFVRRGGAQKGGGWEAHAVPAVLPCLNSLCPPWVQSCDVRRFGSLVQHAGECLCSVLPL